MFGNIIISKDPDIEGFFLKLCATECNNNTNLQSVYQSVFAGTMNAEKDMADVEGLNYITNYQQSLFKDSSNILANAHIKRRCLVQTYSASMVLLNSDNGLDLTKLNLEKYSNNEYENNENIYEKHITSNIKAQEFKCCLNNVDIKALLKPLPCAVHNSFHSPKTENINENDLCEFMNISNQDQQVVEQHVSESKGRKIAKSFAPRCCAPKSNKIYKTLSTTDTAVTNTVEHNSMNDNKGLETNPSTSSIFKTAREEFNIQNLKRFGIGSVSQTQLGGQKRKLGTRRTFQNKFISPMLSNNGSEEQLRRSDEWLADQEIDERLKNIEPRMVELIRAEIMDTGTPVDWDDIAGLEFAKTAIQEAVVWPLLRPDIFTGLRRPPKGILLFGPPGTGKTLIGKCVASQSKSTFFSISASSLTSKWIGDGEKMVRALFTVARCYQPAVIFIDEIDSLLSQRSETEHESSRRIKTEFLVQLDGATTDNEERILVIGATNRPQELDEAARRRFVKRLYIPLPELQARLELVTRLMGPERHSLVDENMQEISQLSDGYSGADMKNLCSEASLGPIRCIDMKMIQSIQSTEVRPVNMEDFIKAFSRVKSSVSPSDLDHYLAWNKTYGSGGAF